MRSGDGEAARDPAPPTPATPITADRVRQLLAPPVLPEGSPFKLPSAAAITELAGFLTGAARMHAMQPTVAAWADEARDLGGACKVLEVGLPALLHQVRTFAASHPPFAELVAAKVIALDDLLRAVAHARQTVFELNDAPRSDLAQYDLPKNGSPWHTYAPAIFEAFADAMASTNNGRTFGLSRETPGCKFVTAAIPLITGDAPSIEAVGKFLRGGVNRDAQKV